MANVCIYKFSSGFVRVEICPSASGDEFVFLPRIRFNISIHICLRDQRDYPRLADANVRWTVIADTGIARCMVYTAQQSAETVVVTAIQMRHLGLWVTRTRRRIIT